MTPDRRRPHRPETVAGDTVLVQIWTRGLHPDEDPYKGQRIGRPERSPSLPPPDETDRPAGPPAGGV